MGVERLESETSLSVPFGCDKIGTLILLCLIVLPSTCPMVTVLLSSVYIRSRVYSKRRPAPVFPDYFLKNPYKHCRKNPYRLKKFRTFFNMGIKLKDFASTVEIRPTFLKSYYIELFYKH